jgi:hypothetical protein
MTDQPLTLYHATVRTPTGPVVDEVWDYTTAAAANKFAQRFTGNVSMVIEEVSDDGQEG